MRWLQNISFSSSSSSSSTVSATSSSPKKHPPECFSDYDQNNLSQHSRSRHQQQQQNHRLHRGFRIVSPKLTRQRKLRHLSDQEVVASKSPATVDAMEPPLALSRSPSCYENYSVPGSRPSYASPAVALPLPLPTPEGDGEHRILLSPREMGQAKAAEDRDRNRDKGDGPAGEGVPLTPIARLFAGTKSRMTMEQGVVRSSSRAVRQGVNRVEKSPDEFRVNIPARSAPNSPFTSPVLSPQRTSTADIFPYYYMVPQGNQVWSAPEMAAVDIPGLPPPAFFDFTAFSTDNSPLHSPPNRSPRRHNRSPSGPSSPLHPKLSLETSSTWQENNGPINFHPLPLPPGAVLSSPTTPAPLPTTKPEPLPMNSQWQKGKLIGRGTFGSVYVASNRETGALCAMKEVEIFPDDPKSAECIRQLEQEIKVLSQLKHPNIVQYYGSEIVEDRFYIYLEYVHPGSINKYVRDHCGAITESVVRNFTRHILSGLAYLHSTKTIHRDIKGANLLVDASGVVKLADFGMAKHLTGQRADLSLKGSPYWMAPELMQAVMQKDNSSDLALAVDIWSLGCTIIEMLTGKPPWSEYEGAAAMFKVMRDTPPIPETLSPEGKDFLRCCFRRNPAERPSATVLLEHRFLKNSQSGIQSATTSVNGIKSMDMPFSPKEHSESKLDQVPVLPSSRSTRAPTSDSETAQGSQHETSDLTVASRYSPRSTLDLPNLSPPRSGGQNMHRLSPSISILGYISCGSKENPLFRYSKQK